MNSTIKTLEDKLKLREAQNCLRSLSLSSGVDFCSNDYLGLARSRDLRICAEKKLRRYGDRCIGSTGSRLLSGNSSFAEKLEQKIADFHEAEAGLLFNSGYDANIGLLSSIAQRHDTILYDELSHASIIDGISLSHATSYKFKHNNVADLETKLSKAKGNIFIVIESVYSMGGDMAPIEELSRLAKNYEANLIVDEAHTTGIFGKDGRGLVSSLQLQDQIFARIHTFGKALGTHGAIIVGSNMLRSYLINFARSFIYTTALPPHSLSTIECAYTAIEKANSERVKLFSLITHFKNTAQQYDHMIRSQESISPIQSILTHDNNTTKKAANYLQMEGFDIRPILSPTVPKGQERLRICLHSFNTETNISLLLEKLSIII